MSIQPRHAVAALACAFIVGTVGGGILLGDGGDSANGTTIPFNPTSDEQTSTPSPTPKAKDDGAFTAEAIKKGKRIVITGTGAEPGAKLIVQRKESGGWQDFPARATVASDGSYSTYIITSRSGAYRLKDTGSDAASAPVQIDP